MSLFERLWRLKPNPIKGNDDVPQFYDTEQGISFLTRETAAQFLGDWLDEHGREAKYPLAIQNWKPGNKQDIEPGMYLKTNFTAQEWEQSQMIRHAHGTLLTYILNEERMLKREELLRVTHRSKYETPEGYTIVKIEVVRPR